MRQKCNSDWFVDDYGDREHKKKSQQFKRGACTCPALDWLLACTPPIVGLDESRQKCTKRRDLPINIFYKKSNLFSFATEMGEI